MKKTQAPKDFSGFLEQMRARGKDPLALATAEKRQILVTYGFTNVHEIKALGDERVRELYTGYIKRLVGSESNTKPRYTLNERKLTVEEVRKLNLRQAAPGTLVEQCFRFDPTSAKGRRELLRSETRGLDHYREYRLPSGAISHRIDFNASGDPIKIMWLQYDAKGRLTRETHYQARKVGERNPLDPSQSYDH